MSLKVRDTTGTLCDIAGLTKVDTTLDSTSSHAISNGAVTTALGNKVNEPSSEGTSGQVLTTDGSGGRTWTTVHEEDVLRTETIETIGGTASKAYSAGEYFIGTDGLLYKATAAIASGGTITVNTNCEKASVEEVLGDCITTAGGTVTGTLIRNVGSVDLLQADNGITAGSNVATTYSYVSDKNGYNMGASIGQVAKSDGSTQCNFMIKNRQTDGTELTSGIDMRQYKNGKSRCDYKFTNSFNYGDLFRIMSAVDASKANNDVSSDTYATNLRYADKNEKDLASHAAIIRANGSVGEFWYIKNYNTSGKQIAQKGITLYLNKSGNLTYNFDDPTNANAALGTGYGTCDTAEATAAKTATLANYVLAPNGYVTIKFTNAVPANATLNINGKGAKPIYYRGAAISDGVINAGDRATFIYNGSQYDLIAIDHAVVEQDHNVPRKTPKDITAYVTDGSLWKRLNGTDGYSLFEDIFVGDYWQMSRPITAPNQDSRHAVTGSQYVTIAGIDSHMGDGDGFNNISKVNYHHLVMVPGKGFSGDQHFGKNRMNPTNIVTGGYLATEMNTSTIGSVATTGSTASNATINEQLYAEFGSHLKTTREMMTNNFSADRYNRYGTLGASSGHQEVSCQAILLNEVSLYGTIAFGSSGYEVGNSYSQYPLFRYSRQAQNNGTVYYWLRDIAYAEKFCVCRDYGYADSKEASAANFFVRPRFILA